MCIDIDKRIQWLDILRGLATVLVVIGHSEVGTFSKYIYWFHMPLFFVLSGLLFKSVKNTAEVKLFIKERTYRLLIPYFSYLIFVFVFFQLPILFFQGFDFLHICTHFLIVLFIGGRTAGGLFGVYWFFTCLLMTQIIFAVIQINIKSIKCQLLIIFALYLLAHIEANYIKAGFMSIPIPWNVDVSMFALLFYAFGFYAKDLLDSKKSKLIKILSISIKMNTVFVIAIILSCIFIILNASGIIDYSLDLKHVMYNAVLMDLIIPIILILSTVFIIQLNLPGSVKNVLTSIGTNSLPIIFLHIPVIYSIDIINHLFIHMNSEFPIACIILGIVLPFYINTLIFRKIGFVSLTG